MRNISSFIPKGTSGKGSLMQHGTEGYTYSFTIEVSDDRSTSGKYTYNCALPVRKDDDGEYVDFSESPNLRDLLGKIYLADIVNP